MVVAGTPLRLLSAIVVALAGTLAADRGVVDADGRGGSRSGWRGFGATNECGNGCRNRRTAGTSGGDGIAVNPVGPCIVDPVRGDAVGIPWGMIAPARSRAVSALPGAWPLTAW